MFGIGFSELVIIAIFALVFVGPQRLPDLMRQLGKFFVQVRRMSNDVKSSVDQVIQDAEAELRREEHKKLEASIQRQMAAQQAREATLDVAASEVAPNPPGASSPTALPSSGEANPSVPGPVPTEGSALAAQRGDSAFDHIELAHQTQAPGEATAPEAKPRPPHKDV